MIWFTVGRPSRGPLGSWRRACGVSNGSSLQAWLPRRWLPRFLNSTPALAWRRYYGGRGGPALAAGILGLMAGAIVGGVGRSPGYYAYPPAPNPNPAPACKARVPLYDDWGNLTSYKVVRVAC